MRRHDTGWRDSLLAARHEQWGHPTPTIGTMLPMVEYDRGQPVALISYHKRGVPLPTGEEVTRVYHALGKLMSQPGVDLPFLTAQYDPRNWAFRLFGHNQAAHDFLGTRDWVVLSEVQFVDNLYRLRQRYMPDLAAWGVEFARDGWITTEPAADWPNETWPGAAMSQRRRNYEPVSQVRASWRNPCVDIDLAVVDQDDRVALIVDYKAPGARIGLDSTNLKALSRLRTTYGGSSAPTTRVATMVVGYEPHSRGWKFHVHCANESARRLLAYALGYTDGPDDVDTLAEAVAGSEWVDLTEAQWMSVLSVARDV